MKSTDIGHAAFTGFGMGNNSSHLTKLNIAYYFISQTDILYIVNYLFNSQLFF